MKKTVGVELHVDTIKRLDAACQSLKLSRNALLKGMVNEKLNEIEQELSGKVVENKQESTTTVPIPDKVVTDTITPTPGVRKNGYGQTVVALRQ